LYQQIDELKQRVGEAEQALEELWTWYLSLQEEGKSQEEELKKEEELFKEDEFGQTQVCEFSDAV